MLSANSLICITSLGDCAYMNSQHIVTTFEATRVIANRRLKELNENLSRIRIKVEQVFGCLKRKFIILDYCPLRDLDLMCLIVEALCIVHNISVKHRLQSRTQSGRSNLNVDELDSSEDEDTASPLSSDADMGENHQEQSYPRRDIINTRNLLIDLYCE